MASQYFESSVYIERRKLLLKVDSHLTFVFALVFQEHVLIYFQVNANVKCGHHHLLPKAPFLKTQTFRVKFYVLCIFQP